MADFLAEALAGVSPSSRRAWIEMASRPALARLRLVALLAEGVDRNTKSFEEHGFVIGGRPPRGGRG